MSSFPTLCILFCLGSIAGLAQAGESVPPALEGSTGEPKVNIYKAIDLRSKLTKAQLKAGRNTVYTDKAGRKLQVEVTGKGVITGYSSVDPGGRISKVHVKSDRSVALRPGEQALVHKCFIMTKECENNPLPRSGNPEDCSVEIECPKPGSLSNLLTR